jgi:hypothetical protein
MPKAPVLMLLFMEFQIITINLWVYIQQTKKIIIIFKKYPLKVLASLVCINFRILRFAKLR